MSEYTAGHIDAIAERLRSAPANSMLGTHVTLGISDTAAAVRALDAYAATLRQQSEPAVAVSDEVVTAAARVLCAYESRECGVDKDDNWNLYADDFKAQARPVVEAVAPLLQSHTQGDAVAYFAADPAEGDFSTHDTLEAARADAEKMLGYAQDAASEEGWTDEPPQICYGIVVGKCVEKEGSRKPAPEGSEYAELVDYRLTAQSHPERAKVPADFRARLLDALNLYYRLGANGAENESAEDADALMLFLTAPSQPKDVQS